MMNSSKTVTNFLRLRTDHLPDVHAVDERLQIFWVLSAAKANQKFAELSAAQISEILCDVCAISITRQGITATLERAKKSGHVATVRREGKLFFRIMKKGEDELVGGEGSPLFVDPAKALTSIRAFEEILSPLTGNIRVCDTYIDSRTLDYIAQSNKADSVRLLTENVQESSRLKRDLAAFAKEYGIPIEIRVSTPGQLHDRYILHEDGMLWMGASLKDYAKKQSMIVKLPLSVAAEISKAFDRYWSGAVKFC